ncbi:MAG: MAC/perforin domain-containing protein [Geminicoccaceae bacterium]
MPTVKLLPGVGSLGQGFDIFGRYDDTSLKAPLFDFDVDEESGFTVEAPGGTFLRPFNTQPNFAANPARGAALVFSSRAEYVEHLETKADVRANYRAFTGAFTFSFNVDKKEEANFSYAIYEYEKQLWSIQIVDASTANLAAHVLDDPVFRDVPQTYIPGENAYLFYRFFLKYGTHFVRSVDVGARLNYCVTAKKTFLSEKTAIQSKLDAEIDAVFMSGSAEASAKWSRAGKEWTENRQIHIDVVGGENAKLAAVRPGFEQNYKALFDTWIDTLATRPGTINFRLSPIEELFTGDQAEQVRRAAAAYADSQLHVVSERTDSAVLLNGMRVELETVGPAGEYPSSVVKIAVIDGDTLQPVLRRAYRIANRDFTAVMHDMRSYERDDRYIVAIALASEPGSRPNSLNNGYSGVQFPTGDFYAFLLGCGGGDAVAAWHDKYHHSSADYTDHVTLAFVGCCGAQTNSGIGTLGHNEGAYAPPRVEAAVFLRAVGMGGGKIRFKPEPM